MKNLIPMLICLFLVVPSQAGIIYVDDDANGANNGTRWANAYNYLQDALAAVVLRRKRYLLDIPRFRFIRL